MAARGPAPTPTRILKLRGSPRARGRKREPSPKAGMPAMPADLDGDARSCWKRLAGELDGLGVVSHADANALERYCRLWARWREAEREIAEKGSTFETEKGYVGQQPSVAIAQKLAIALLRLEQEFGLTPASRTRVRKLDESVDDDARTRRFFAG